MDVDFALLKMQTFFFSGFPKINSCLYTCNIVAMQKKPCDSCVTFLQ